MPPKTFSTSPEIPLAVSFDVERRLGVLRRDHTVKGFFTVPVVKRLGDGELDRLRPRLLQPPKRNHLPFTDYPVADHQLLTIELVRKEHLNVPLAEGIRRFERTTATRFADSVLGKVMLAVIDGPKPALLKLPEVAGMVSNTGRVKARPHPDGVSVEYRDYSGFLDCAMIGALEGVVMLFRRTPKIDATIHSEHDADYIVRWT